MPRNRFTRSLSHLAIPNITAYIIAFQLMAMMLIWMKPEVEQQFVFDAGLALHGEWWRSITFLFLPASTSPLWAFFVYYFLYIMGTALESEWGAARYNFFLLVGVLMTIASAFFALLVGLPAGIGTNTYLLESVFLAFAALYPDYVIYLFFILPIRVKWLALLTWLLLAFQFLTADWTGRVMLLASVANFLLFFWRDILDRLHHGRRQMSRQIKRIHSTGPASSGAMHTCTICGATEKSHPQYEFRYAGGLCYCLEHLPAHTHRP